MKAKATKGGKRKAAKARDLTARKGSDAKGGALGSALSSVLKAQGDALATAARKG